MTSSWLLLFLVSVTELSSMEESKLELQLVYCLTTLGRRSVLKPHRRSEIWRTFFPSFSSSLPYASLYIEASRSAFLVCFLPNLSFSMVKLRETSCEVSWLKRGLLASSMLD